MVQKRLRLAKKLLDENKRDAFFEEIERAVWTYLSDRLSIPTAELNKANIEQILKGKGVEDNMIGQVTDVLATAAFARYAPASSDHDMEDLYNKVVTVFANLKI